MSGRYALFRWPQALSGLPGFPADLAQRWNLSPGAQVPFLFEHEGELRVASGRWGLTPAWLSDFTKAPAHARAETLAEQPMFREAFAARRCLLPANGFYEWRGQAARKRPYWLSAGEGLLYFAGLWEIYPAAGQDYLSVAMVTREAAYLRRPLLLDQASSRLWLAAGTAPEQLQTLLAGPQPVLRERALATLINDPASEGPECLTPA
ncbi:SOS response-associated peptidase [Pseudomonas sp. CAU 1711]|uniref:SOS response-associated peptidase n=1 Tax=Pseudomonas sp. CAU 1711 TaxID=3140356 RepID=UPI0032601C97